MYLLISGVCLMKKFPLEPPILQQGPLFNYQVLQIGRKCEDVVIQGSRDRRLYCLPVKGAFGSAPWMVNHASYDFDEYLALLDCARMYMYLGRLERCVLEEGSGDDLEWTQA
jgi:hypothetical protein